MNQKTRDYFQQMYAVSYAYGKAKSEREKEKDALIAADDWDGVQAWYEREKQFPNPYTSGQCKAYRAYAQSSEIELGEIDLSDFLWEKEVKDFSDTLIAAGVTSFVIINQSTALMENIHQLEEQDWRLVGTVKLTVTTHRWGTEETEERLGLRFEIEREV